jgi:hypothetical protein
MWYQGVSFICVWDWKGNIKARRLVLAIHDHFADSRQRAAAAKDAALDKVQHMATTTPRETLAENEPVVRVAEEDELDTREDAWALPFIKLNRVQVQSPAGS